MDTGVISPQTPLVSSSPSTAIQQPPSCQASRLATISQSTPAFLMQSNDGQVLRSYFEKTPARLDQVRRSSSTRPNTTGLNLVSPAKDRQPALMLATKVSFQDASPKPTSPSHKEKASSLGRKVRGSRPATYKNLSLQTATTTAKDKDNLSDGQPSSTLSFSMSDLLPSTSSLSYISRKNDESTTYRAASAQYFSPVTTPLSGDDLSRNALPFDQPESRNMLAGSAEHLSNENKNQVAAIDSNNNNSEQRSPLPDHLDTSFSRLHFSRGRLSSWSMPGHEVISALVQRRSFSHKLATPSDGASSQVGSDNDSQVFSSGDEDDLDEISETAYDSLRTGMTKNSGSFVSPPLETLFHRPDDSHDSEGAVVAHGCDNGESGNAPSPSGPHRNNSEDDNESASTPVRIAAYKNNEVSRTSQASPQSCSSKAGKASAPLSPLSINLGSLSYVNMHLDDEARNEGGEDWDRNVALHQPENVVYNTPTKALAALYHSRSNSNTSNRRHYTDSKSSLFDWAEQPPPEKGDDGRSPPRPRTTHGKNDLDGRGSRPPGRLAPNSRSQSVPLAPDTKKRSNASSKFGTWGIGSKGVTEDWDGDEDFDLEGPGTAEEKVMQEQERLDAGISMFVPQQIQEQQSHVLANISLLREWGLLIEELKVRRVKVTALGVISEQITDVIKKIDAMVDLADNEAADVGPLEDSSATSLAGFDGEDDNNDNPEDLSIHWSGDDNATLAKRVSNAENDEDDTSRPLSTSAEIAERSPEKRPLSVIGPRRNSEAVARSVIEAIQQRRSPSDPVLVGSRNTAPPKKVPFDTAMLKQTVLHVRNLLHSVEQILCDTEALQVKRAREKSDPPFSKAFVRPWHDDSFTS